jgi:hypothetical protein
MNRTKRSELRRIPVRGSHEWTTCSKARRIFSLALSKSPRPTRHPYRDWQKSGAGRIQLNSIGKELTKQRRVYDNRR